MTDLIVWIRNHTQQLYAWIGRLTLLFAVLVIIYIIARAIVGAPGFSFDPLLYILISLLIVIHLRSNTLMEQINNKLTKLPKIDTSAKQAKSKKPKVKGDK